MLIMVNAADRVAARRRAGAMAASCHSVDKEMEQFLGYVFIRNEGMPAAISRAPLTVIWRRHDT